MSKLVTTKAMAKVAAVATGLAMVAGALTFASSADAASLTSTQIQSILSLLSSFGASSATIANVSAALNGQATTGTVTTTTSTSCSFTGALTIGSSGAAVTCLQSALIAGGYSIPAGATGYFGAQTQAAVAAWQKANGITPAAGYFGSISRAHWNLGGSSSSSTTTTTTTTGTVGIGSGNGLEVMLSPTSPSGTVLVQGQGIGDLADYTFANPTTSTIAVTGLTFNRIGVSNDATINNVYLYNGVTRITDSAGVSSSQFSFNNAAGIFTVAPGTSVTISVRADIATGTSGQQIGASLVSVASSGTLASTDSFPINSGYQTISAANLATVSFNATTLPSAGDISPQSSYTAWQNTVSVSTNPVWLKAMTFTNLGSIDSSDIGNFRLYVDGTQVGSAVSSFTSGRTVTFDLSANPVELSTQSHVIKVLADVTGGASLTFQLSLQRSSDSLFVDSQLNQPVTPTSNNSATSYAAVNAGLITINSVNGSSGVSVSKDPASATNAISMSSTNQNLATFDMLASGEPTKVTDLFVCANTETALITGAGGGLANGKIYFNGVQVGSTKAIAECSPEGSSPTAGTDFSLGSSLILPAGQTAMVSVYADAKTGVATSTTAANTSLLNNNAITIELVPATSNAQGQDSLQSANVPNASAVAGNPVSVNSSALTASKFSGYANQTIIPGSQNALIGEFTLAAGSTEGVNVNTIGINASTTWATYLQNLKLVNMSNGQQIGTTISTPSGAAYDGPNSFSLGSNLVIPESGSVTIGVYANILSTATGQSGALSVSASGTSGTGASTGNVANLAAQAELQNINANAGSLTVSLGASNPVAVNAIAGASSLEAGDFTFNANNSNYTIQKLEVDVPNATAAALTSVGIKYTDVNGATQTAMLSGASSVTSASTTYQFTGLDAFVPSNGQSDISVWVGTPTVANAGASLSGIKIAVTLDGGNGFQAIDQSGTQTTTFGSFLAGSGNGLSSNATTGYGTIVVRKSIPTYTMLTNPNTTPSSGQSLYQFSVAADPAGAIDVDQFAFNVATSSSGSMYLTNWNLYDITSGSAVAVGSANQSAATGVLKFALGSTTQQIGAGQSKTYELTATVAGWAGTGTTITVSLAQDTASHANTDADSNENLGYYQVWSDRSATSHTSDTSDYTNGYLLKNFVNDVTSYTHN